MYTKIENITIEDLQKWKEIFEKAEFIEVVKYSEEENKLDFDEYQSQAIGFRSKDLTDRESKLTMTLGLCGETSEATEEVERLLLLNRFNKASGNVGELVKKHVGHGHELDISKLKKELGDVLWYLAAVADEFKIKLSDVAESNIKKLSDRYKSRQFTTEESVNRKE